MGTNAQHVLKTNASRAERTETSQATHERRVPEAPERGTSTKPSIDSSITAIRSAIARWSRIVSSESPQALKRRLERLGPVPANEVRLRTASISRGLRLIDAAPRIGDPKGASGTDRARNAQWRFTAVYCGFEIAMKGLLGRAAIRDVNDVLGVLAQSGHRAPTPIPISLHRQAVVAPDDELWILDFLAPWKGDDSNDRKTIRSWIVASSPRKSWEQVLSAAGFIRNATVHGALSASRLVELGMISRATAKRGAAGVLEGLEINLRTFLSFLIARVLAKHKSGANRERFPGGQK